MEGKVEQAKTRNKINPDSYFSGVGAAFRHVLGFAQGSWELYQPERSGF